MMLQYMYQASWIIAHFSHKALKTKLDVTVLKM